MHRAVTEILKKYGTAMTVICGGAAHEVKGFFQPVHSKSWQNMLSQGTLLGELPQGEYVYIGPGEVSPEPGDFLKVQGKTYEFRRVMPYFWGEKRAYLWGLCLEREQVTI